MKRSVIILMVWMAAASVFCQVKQPGLVLEYNGKEQKTPLQRAVQIIVDGAASTVSDTKTGAFELNFNNKRKGDHIVIASAPRAIGYELMNTHELESWNINPGSDLRIIFCKQQYFNDLCAKYYNISLDSYKKKYDIAVKKLEEERKNNVIKDAEYKKKYADLQEEYNRSIANIDSYVDNFARIDLSEIGEKEQEIIALVENGQVDEAIARYEDLNLVAKLQREISDAKTIKGAVDKLNETYEEKKRNITSLYASIDIQIQTYKLAGGRENLEKVHDVLYELLALDSTNYKVQEKLAKYYIEVKKFADAEKFYLLAADNAKAQGDTYNAISLYQSLGYLCLSEANSGYNVYGQNEDLTNYCKANQYFRQVFSLSDTTRLTKAQLLDVLAPVSSTDYIIGKYRDAIDVFKDFDILSADHGWLQDERDSVLFYYAEMSLGYSYLEEGDTYSSIEHCISGDLYGSTYCYADYNNGINLLRSEDWPLNTYDGSRLFNSTELVILALEYSMKSSYHTEHDINANRNNPKLSEALDYVERLIPLFSYNIRLLEAKGLLYLWNNSPRAAYETYLEIKKRYPERISETNSCFLNEFESYYDRVCEMKLDISIPLSIYRNGEFGIVDRDGHEIIPCNYDMGINLFDSTAIVCKSKKWGVAAAGGKWLVKPDYTFLSVIDMVYINDELWGIDYEWTGNLNMTYTPTIKLSDQLELDAVERDKIKERARLYLAGRNGKYGILLHDGTEVIPCKYDQIMSESHTIESSIFFVDSCWSNACVVVKDNGKYGVINLRGEILLPIEQDSIGYTLFYDDLLVCRNNKKGIYSPKSKSYIMPCEYDDYNCNYIGSTGTAYDGRLVGYNYGDHSFISFKKDGLWGFADRDGTIIIPNQYDEVTDFCSECSYSIVKKHGKYGIINERGETTLEVIYDSISQRTLDLVTLEKDSKYGVCDLQGHIFIPVIYDEIIYGECFKESKFLVPMLFARKGDKWSVFGTGGICYADSCIEDIFIGDYYLNNEMKYKGNWISLSYENLINIK